MLASTVAKTLTFCFRLEGAILFRLKTSLFRIRQEPTFRSTAQIELHTHTPTPQYPQHFTVLIKPFSSFTVRFGKSLSAAMDSDVLRHPEPPVDNPRADPDIENLEDSIVFVDGERSDDDGLSNGGAERDESQNQDQNDTQNDVETRVLPEELAARVMRLSCESSVEGRNCDVYLVGTAHVSQASCIEVEAVISCLKPEVVFLELCTSRVAVLSPQNLKVPTMGEMVDMWKKKQNLFGILYSWFLAKLANKLEVFPGAEFRVAFEEAMKYGGKVILGDRPVQITLRRTWGKMPLWHKTKLIYSLLFQAFFLPNTEELNRLLKEMDDVDMLTLVVQEMSKKFPTVMETLVYERDQYMSSTLLRVAKEHRSVVAVVGKGHLQGIKKNWKQPVMVEKLLELPSQTPAVSARKMLTTIGAAVAGVAIIYGIFLSSKK